MTLDPVHVDGIAALAGQIESRVDDDDHDDMAERVWADFLDPLRVDGRTVIEPVDEQRRRRVDVESIALADSPVPSAHGLDAGTLNPTTYRNGAVVDVAHAAMASEPSDHDLHRSRTVVGAVHRNDTRTTLPEGWESFDNDYCRRRWIEAPRMERFAEAVVHTLALYHAEISHARTHVDDVDDLLVLDGPIYPKELLRWEDRHRELRDTLVSEPLPRELIEAYLALSRTCRERSLPLLGFVKNPSSNRITRAVRRAELPAPWFNDGAFFRRLLATGRRDELTHTNWFRSAAGTDRTFGGHGGVLGLDVPDGAAVTFMAIFDPRDGIVYRAEAPAWVTADADRRERLTRYLLREVAAERGPPRTVAKADRLARIGRSERRSLRDLFSTAWESDVDRTYDDLRWGAEDQ